MNPCIAQGIRTNDPCDNFDELLWLLATVILEAWQTYFLLMAVLKVVADLIVVNSSSTLQDFYLWTEFRAGSLPSQRFSDSSFPSLFWSGRGWKLFKQLLHLKDEPRGHVLPSSAPKEALAPFTLGYSIHHPIPYLFGLFLNKKLLCTCYVSKLWVQYTCAHETKAATKEQEEVSVVTEGDWEETWFLTNLGIDRKKEKSVFFFLNYLDDVRLAASYLLSLDLCFIYKPAKWYIFHRFLWKTKMDLNNKFAKYI